MNQLSVGYPKVEIEQFVNTKYRVQGKRERLRETERLW